MKLGSGSLGLLADFDIASLFADRETAAPATD